MEWGKMETIGLYEDCRAGSEEPVTPVFKRVIFRKNQGERMGTSRLSSQAPGRGRQRDKATYHLLPPIHPVPAFAHVASLCSKLCSHLTCHDSERTAKLALFSLVSISRKH